MQNWFIFILLFLAACSPSAAPPAASGALPTLTPALTIETTPHPQRQALETQTEWACPEGLNGQTLHVANWYDYIAENTVANFEALCGVTVTYTTHESNEQMLQQLRDGADYDVVVPTGYMVESMIAENLLYAPDRAHLSNFSALDSTLLNPPTIPTTAILFLICGVLSALSTIRDGSMVSGTVGKICSIIRAASVGWLIRAYLSR